MLIRKFVGAVAGFCFGLAAVCALFLFAVTEGFSFETVIVSQYGFGLFVFVAGGVGCLIVYRSNSGDNANVSSEKKCKPLKVDSSEALAANKIFPAGCKIETQSGKSEHLFTEPIVVILPVSYVEAGAPEDSTEAKEEDEEESIFGDPE